MREILSRGKRVDNGEWVEGSLITDVFYRVGKGNKNSIPYILSVSGIDYDSWEDLDDDYGLYEVDPDTIGQYTGLTDKNGKKIFEGDIVKENDIVHKEEIQIKGKCSTVSFEKGCWVLLSNVTWNFLQTNAKAVEIIGNIHDNPELLEDKPDD